MHDLKHLFDAGATIAAGMTLIGWIANALPPVAALASLLWIGFQWYHSAPMQERRAQKRKE